MNSGIIRYVLGYVIKFEAVLLLLPSLVALYYREHCGIYFVAIALFCGLFGILMTLRKPTNTIFYLKEGCVTTALSWILLSIFGCLPFLISGEIPSFTDAMFETVSGFTTTGASILSDPGVLPRSLLFWRSFTHWIGGMGVLVFLLAIIPLSGGSNINLMRAESPGPSVGKLVPKVKHTARLLYLIYFSLTVIEFFFLVAGKMPLFDSVCTSLGTAGTGGFGIKADSIGGYSPYLQWVVTIFMILFGVNFNAYYLIIFGKIKKAFAIEEIKYYFLIIFSAIGIIFINILSISKNAFEALTNASFQVGSIISSTGFSTTDFDTWNGTAKSVLVLLMFIGACAGSTGGGIKVSRIVIMVKTIFKEIASYIHPKSVRKIKMDDKAVEHDVVRSVNVYLITFLLLFSTSILLITVDEFDMTTNFTSVIACLNNIGPGLNMVGPTRNFSIFSLFSKWVLIVDMIAGRLELFPLLILFHPGVWKDLFLTTHMQRVTNKKEKKNKQQ